MRSSVFRARRARGSTLVVTVVLVAVLTVVAAGLLRRSQSAVEASNQKRHYDTSVSCAEAARELLLSKFRVFGVNLSELRLNQAVGDRRLVSGHYDQLDVKSVRPLGANTIGQDTATGMANRAAPVALGGSPYLFTVVCADSTGTSRQTEVEFFIRFGL